MTTSEEPLDPGHLDELDVDECRRLLTTQQVGRLGVIVGQYPLIFPVNYAIQDDDILFRSGPGTKLYAVEHSNVTFEVDEIDVVHRSGWSVLIRGTAREISAVHNPDLAAGAQGSGASPWAPGDRAHLVRVVPDQISGRRIRPGELPSPFDRRGYL